MVAKKLVFAMVAKKIVQIPLFYNIYSYAITNYSPDVTGQYISSGGSGCDVPNISHEMYCCQTVNCF